VDEAVPERRDLALVLHQCNVPYLWSLLPLMNDDGVAAGFWGQGSELPFKSLWTWRRDGFGVLRPHWE